MNAQTLHEIQAFQANEDDAYNGDYVVQVSEGCVIYYEVDDLSLDMGYDD